MKKFNEICDKISEGIIFVLITAIVLGVIYANYWCHKEIIKEAIREEKTEIGK